MKKGDDLVTEASLDNQTSVGISDERLVAGVVSFYEEHSIRQKLGYTLPVWELLDPQEQAFEIAIHRISTSINNHFKDKEISDGKKASRRR